jgi:hypothetical protein
MKTFIPPLNKQVDEKIEIRVDVAVAGMPRDYAGFLDSPQVSVAKNPVAASIQPLTNCSANGSATSFIRCYKGSCSIFSVPSSQRFVSWCDLAPSLPSKSSRCDSKSWSSNANAHARR